MTTVWRPRVRIPVPDIDGADARREAERRVDDEGHEAEESPDALRALRARGEASLEVQGVQRLSARSSAP